MELLKPPPYLYLDATSLSENWHHWSQQFELFLEAPGQASATESQKVAILLHCAGAEAIEVYNTFVFDPASDSQVLSEVIKQFNDHCNPRKNLEYEWYNFWETNQQDWQSFSHYLTDLRTLSKSCEFVEVDICRAAEASRTQMQSMCKMPLEVKELRRKGVRFAGHGARDNGAVFTRRDARRRESRDNTNGAVDQEDVCPRCGYQCGRDHDCPVIGRECNKCGWKGHFQRVCGAKPRQSVHTLRMDT